MDTQRDWYIDDLSLHDYNYCMVSAWAALEDLKEDGYARSIGVSDINIQELNALLVTAQKEKPAVVKIELSPSLYETQ